MLFLLWWCFDDHLAAAVGNPGVGQIPWWVMLLLSLALSASVSANGSSK